MTESLGFTEQLMFTTVRVECLLSSGKVSVGTGFIYRANVVDRPDGQSDSQVLIVTNRHVVESVVRTTYYLHVVGEDGLPKLGAQQRVSLDYEQTWIFHPTLDLAFSGLYLPFEILEKRGFTPFYKGLDRTHVPTPADWEQFVPGEEVLMVGYPIGLYDTVNNLPVIRRGIIASHPGVGFDGRPEFLIDAACFPGSSGSPVFLVNLGRRLTRRGAELGVFDAKFLGILWGGPVMKPDGEVQPTEIPTAKSAGVEIPINLGYCLRSTCVIDLDAMVAQIMAKNADLGVDKLQREIIERG